MDKGKKPIQHFVKIENSDSDEEVDSSHVNRAPVSSSSSSVFIRRNAPNQALHLVSRTPTLTYASGHARGVSMALPPPHVTTPSTLVRRNPTVGLTGPVPPTVGLIGPVQSMHFGAVGGRGLVIAPPPATRPTSSTAIVSWNAGLIVTSLAQFGGRPPRAPFSNYGSTMGSLSARLNLIPPQFSTVVSPFRSCAALENRQAANLIDSLGGQQGSLVETSPQRRKRNMSDVETGSSLTSNEAHDGDIPPPCCMCNRQFNSWKGLYGHMKSHRDRQWRGIFPPPDMNVDGTMKSPEQKWQDRQKLQEQQLHQQIHQMQQYEQRQHQVQQWQQQPVLHRPEHVPGCALPNIPKTYMDVPTNTASSSAPTVNEKVNFNIDLNVVPDPVESPPHANSPLPPPLFSLIETPSLNPPEEKEGVDKSRLFDLNRSPPKEE